MTNEEIEKRYGKKVWENEHHVLRVSEEDTDVIVRLHRKEYDIEQSPLAYMLGSNMLTTERS